jgi:hypothetical protein
VTSASPIRAPSYPASSTAAKDVPRPTEAEATAAAARRSSAPSAFASAVDRRTAPSAAVLALPVASGVW